MPDSNQQPPVPRLELYPIELIPCTGRVHTNRSIHTVRWVALVRRAGLNEPAPQERHTPPSLSLDEATFLALCPTPATGWRLTFLQRKKNPGRQADQGFLVPGRPIRVAFQVHCGRSTHCRLAATDGLAGKSATPNRIERQRPAAAFAGSINADFALVRITGFFLATQSSKQWARHSIPDVARVAQLSRA